MHVFHAKNRLARMWQQLTSTFRSRRHEPIRTRTAHRFRPLMDLLEDRCTPSISGAIYTSLNDGTAVNANLFPSIDAVYLNGGPQNANGNGLPNGNYYYQVTDPSGHTLLSTDPV